MHRVWVAIHIPCDADIGPCIEKLRPVAKDLSRTISSTVLILLDRSSERSNVICAFKRGSEFSFTGENYYEP